MNIFSKKVKKYTLFSLLVFSIFTAMGFIFSYLRPDQSALFFEELSEEFSFIHDFDSFLTFLFIFFNNSVKIFIGMILGVFFGIFPLFFLMVNGLVLGLVMGHTFPQVGIPGLLIMLAPHGIFELPALFIGAGLGINVGVTTYEEVKKGNLTTEKLFKEIKKLTFPSEIRKAYLSALEIFFKVVLPLLFIAAIIETILIFYLL